MITVHGTMPVYSQPKKGAEILFYTVEGEKLRVQGRARRGYRKVRSGNGAASGYVRESDLRRSERLGSPLGKWGFGGGGAYTYLSQAREPFSTSDQVTYKPSSYKSTAFAPLLGVQRGRRDFWRFILARKMVRFRGSAKTDVAGSSEQKVTLDMDFWSLEATKAWSPWRGVPVYFGFDFELAKATSQVLTLNSVVLPTSGTGLPIYAGLQAVAGACFYTRKHWSLYTEARAGGIWNQAPVIFEAEAALGVLFWP
jgi:hypothetical protein